MNKKAVILDGIRLMLYGDKQDLYFRDLQGTGNRDLFFALNRLFPRGNFTYIDIGANIGLTSLYASKRFPDAQIFSIEPDKKSFGFLEKNVIANQCKNIQIYNIAAGEKKGQQAFFESDIYSAANHIVTSGDMSADPRNAKTTVNVQVDTLDNIIPETAVVRFVKIDTEGFEREVLVGALEIIRRNRAAVFFVEFNSWCLLSHRGVKPIDFLKFLKTKFSHIYCVSQKEFVRIDDSISEWYFLHKNIVIDGCVGDLVCTNQEIDGALNIHEFHALPPKFMQRLKGIVRRVMRR